MPILRRKGRWITTHTLAEEKFRVHMAGAGWGIRGHQNPWFVCEQNGIKILVKVKESWPKALVGGEKPMLGVASLLDVPMYFWVQGHGLVRIWQNVNTKGGLALWWKKK